MIKDELVRIEAEIADLTQKMDATLQNASISKADKKRANRYAHKIEMRRAEIDAYETQRAEDVYFMQKAIGQAKKAMAIDEVPIGCVIVKDHQIIARGYNRRNKDQSTLSHAEVSAIRKASKVLKDWRLEGCTLYVTLEPCQMCAGAIVQARVPRVVFGARNPKAGCAGSVCNILQMDEFNHQVIVEEGVLENPCTALMKTFFLKLRKDNL